MSIVACPKCGKKVSSHAPICDHCGHREGELREQDLQRYRARRLRSRVYHLKLATYAVMALVVVAIGWLWVESGGFVLIIDHRGPFYLLLLGSAAYLVIRALLFRARRQQKENNKARSQAAIRRRKG